MAYHNDMNFTTKDSDNNQHGSINCAQVNGPGGGWWYKSCRTIQPNVVYNNRLGVVLNGKWHPLPFIEMKIRPHNCNI